MGRFWDATTSEHCRGGPEPAHHKAFLFGGEHKQRPSKVVTGDVSFTRIGYNSSEKLLCGGWSGSDHLVCKQCKLHVTWLRGQLSAVILASVAAGRITIDALSPSGPPWTAGHWIGPRSKVPTDIPLNAQIVFLLEPLLASAVLRAACKHDIVVGVMLA